MKNFNLITIIVLIRSYFCLENNFHYVMSDLTPQNYYHFQSDASLQDVRNKIKCGIMCSRILDPDVPERIMNVINHNTSLIQCAVHKNQCYFIHRVEPKPCRNVRIKTITTCTSCKEIKEFSSSIETGIYYISTPTHIIKVFCDFQPNRILTFISKYYLSILTTSDLQPLYNNANYVVLRQNWKGVQKDSHLSQLSRYSTLPLTFYVNENDNFLGPHNRVFGAYIFIGFLDDGRINRGSINGYATNGVDRSFSNCGRTGHSYFTFYPNLNNEPSETNHNYSNLVDMFAWMNTAQIVSDSQHLPDEFFYITGIHFGGCGGLTTSVYWSTVTGTSAGFVTDL